MLEVMPGGPQRLRFDQTFDYAIYSILDWLQVQLHDEKVIANLEPEYQLVYIGIQHLVHTSVTCRRFFDCLMISPLQTNCHSGSR